MQLLSGTLRCLQAGKSHVRCLLTAFPPAPRWSGSLRAVAAVQQRHFSEAILMSYEEFGVSTMDVSRTPLITMHGLFGSKQNWRSISKVLAQTTNRRIYTVDIRNHGDSPHIDSHDPMGMTADLFHFMQVNGIKKISLMGHSMGGRAAMHFALSYPELVERLVVVDISPVSTPGSLIEIDEIFGAMSSISIPPEITLSAGRKLAKVQLLEVVARDSVDFILLNLRKRPGTGEFYWACNVEVLHKSIRAAGQYLSVIEHLPPFQGPTTFICGSRSQYMSIEDWPQVLRFFPNASIHWLDTGHLVHLEQPQQFIGITTTFLNTF